MSSSTRGWGALADGFVYAIQNWLCETNDPNAPDIHELFAVKCESICLICSLKRELWEIFPTVEANREMLRVLSQWDNFRLAPENGGGSPLDDIFAQFQMDDPDIDRLLEQANEAAVTAKEAEEFAQQISLEVEPVERAAEQARRSTQEIAEGNANIQIAALQAEIMDEESKALKMEVVLHEAKLAANEAALLAMTAVDKAKWRAQVAANEAKWRAQMAVGAEKLLVKMAAKEAERRAEDAASDARNLVCRMASFVRQIQFGNKRVSQLLCKFVKYSHMMEFAPTLLSPSSKEWINSRDDIGKLVDASKNLEIRTTSKNRRSSFDDDAIRNFLQFYKTRTERWMSDDESFVNPMEAARHPILEWSGKKLPCDRYTDSPGHHKGKGANLVLFALIFKMMSILGLDFPELDEHRAQSRDGFTLVGLVANHLALSLKRVLKFVVFSPLKVAHKMNLREFFNEGANQVICQMAFEIYRFLHLGSIGVNRKCRGAFLTPVSIEIMELELRDVGTKEVSVQLRRTGTHLFFDDASTRRLLGLGRKAYLDFQYVRNAAPQGWHVLAQVLRDPPYPTNDVFTSEGNLYHVQSNSKQRINGEQFLRAETFGCIYKLDDNDVLKLPWEHHAVSNLKGEKETLDKLKHDCIPSAEWMDVLFEIGCYSSKLLGLRLKGIVGRPASHYSDVRILQMVYAGVSAALQYANCERNIIHLAVRPCNIIVDDATGRVQLSEWGCSAATSDVLLRSPGAPTYAHDELVYNRPDKWSPVRAYDLASLAFTMAALLYNIPGEPPWGHFYTNAWDQAFVDGRRAWALDLIMESGLSDDFKQEIVAAIHS